MTLSCRAQAFSVDNLLRSSAKAPAANDSASPQQSVVFASQKEFRNLPVNSWTTSPRCLASHQHLLANDDDYNTARVLHSIAFENSKSELWRHQDRIPREESPTHKHFKRGSPDEIVHCYQIYKFPRITDDDDNKDVRKDTASRRSSCGDDNYDEEKGFEVRSQYKASASSSAPSSCFCHSEMNFCSHSGIMTVADTVRADTSIVAELCHADLWSSFHRLGTEMIITKSGRRMFPALKLRITGLNPDKHYVVRLEFVQPDTRKYRYIYHSSRWMVSGSGDTLQAPRVHGSPERSASGQAICSQIVSFERLKLTNTEPSRPGQVSLISMQKFQPQVVVQEARKADGGDVEHSEQYVIIFPQTSFMAVTAYQNQQVTTLKIASNPFAKGFRETGKTRIPFESFVTGLPNLLSCNTPASYLPALVKPSSWSRCFQRDCNSNLVTTSCDKHSGVSTREDLPVKIMKMESKNYGTNYINFDMKRDSTSVDEAPYKSPAASVSMHLLPHESHPLHPHPSHQQDELREQQQHVLSAQQFHIQALLRRVPLHAELLQRIPVPTVNIPTPKDNLQRMSLPESVYAFPRYAHKSGSMKLEHPLIQFSNVHMMLTNVSNPHIHPCEVFRASENNSPRCLCTRLSDNDNLSVERSLVPTTSTPSGSCVEHNWTLTSSQRRPSHDSRVVPLDVPQTRCTTDPTKIDTQETV